MLGYFEIDELENTPAATIVKATKKHFAKHSILETYFTDNGP